MQGGKQIVVDQFSLGCLRLHFADSDGDDPVRASGSLPHLEGNAYPQVLFWPAVLAGFRHEQCRLCPLAAGLLVLGFDQGWRDLQ
jgi:hypothetical protein